MSILLDPKNLIRIKIMYVTEKKKPHNIDIIHFIRNKQEFDEWKEKGYQPKENAPSASVIDKEKTEINYDKLIESLDTTWRRLNWKENNDICSRCLKHIPTADGQIRVEIDGLKLRELKLKTCLKDWDLVDENNNKVPLTSDNIDRLLPEVAHELLETFEEISEPSREQLKN